MVSVRRESQTTTFADVSLLAGPVITDRDSTCPDNVVHHGGGCLFSTTTVASTFTPRIRRALHLECAFRNVTTNTDVTTDVPLTRICGKRRYEELGNLR